MLLTTITTKMTIEIETQDELLVIILLLPPYNYLPYGDSGEPCANNH